ncbi:MAG TPA: sugar phosphate isomerase/epimerase family protein, partial [Chloroflexota bacterium]|nr:sugar phosphate isomerase/epimerase family protein [Chloroflexota bacterium]
FWTDQPAEMAAAPELLRRNHLTLAAYAVGNNFVQAEREARAAHVQMVRDGVDTAARLGAPVLRVFGGSRPKPGSAIGSPAEALQFAIEGLTACAAYAADNGVVLGIENHGGLPGTTAEVRQVLDAVNSPALRLIFDVGNFVGVGDDPVAAARELAPWVAHVHLKDLGPAPSDEGSRREAVPLGDGTINLAEVFRVLHDHHYAGSLAIEYEGKSDPAEAVRRSAAHVRKLLAELA